jgi:hypothetical protein
MCKDLLPHAYFLIHQALLSWNAYSFCPTHIRIKSLREITVTEPPPPSLVQNFSLFNIFFRHVFSPSHEDVASRVDQVRARALERLQQVMVTLVSNHLGVDGTGRQGRSAGETEHAAEIRRRVEAVIQVRLPTI